MAGLRSIVKHSYLSGRSQGVGRAQAHIKYIQFRAGKDKDGETRSFFNGERDDVHRLEIKRAIKEQDERGTMMHKLILSPGVPDADVKEYCREIMADLGGSKGLDLEWYAVRHDNTNNPHVHIVVMGKDENGHRVKITKADYTRIKETGDRYLERNRLLEREERSKEKQPEKQRRGLTKFMDALKAASREFAREMNRPDDREEKPKNRFEQRRQEKEAERHREESALGEKVDISDYLARQADKEERQEARREKAWKEYCKPIEIDRGGHGTVSYDRSTSFEALRKLERDSSKDDRVRSQMSEEDRKRLSDWIQEKYKEERRIEYKAERLGKIELNFGVDESKEWSKESSLSELRRLESLNTRREAYLDPVEQRALVQWIEEAELKEPVRVELEPGQEAMEYDRQDSKASLEFLAGEYEKGEHWAAQRLSKSDYQKVKTWIAEKDREKDKGADYKKDQGREPEKPLKVAKTKDGKDKYVSRQMDLEQLKAAREALAKETGADKEALGELDSWIERKERDEAHRERSNKEPYQPRRRQTAKQKLMEREVRQERTDRFNNYYKEKSEQRERLEAERANLQSQKRALNRYEQQRETVDGQYSEIWGAEKSGIAAGPMGAASGGARPLGANQLMRLIQGIGKNEDQKKAREAQKEKETQSRLEGQNKEAKEIKERVQKPLDRGVENKLEARLKQPKEDKDQRPIEEPAREREESERPKLEENDRLDEDTRKLEKEVENKKKKEEDRDKRKGSDKDRGSPFERDPWGRW